MNSNTLPFCTGVILETKAKKSEAQRLPPLNTDSLFFLPFFVFFCGNFTFFTFVYPKLQMHWAERN